MDNKKLVFCTKWLKYTSIIVVLFGLYMSTASILPKENPSVLDRQVNKSFYQESYQLPKAVIDFQSWLYGVGASMLVSWSILMFFLAKNALSKGYDWTWKTMMIALVAWFIIDESISIKYGVTFNVLFNLILFLLFFIPLLIIGIEQKKLSIKIRCIN